MEQPIDAELLAFEAAHPGRGGSKVAAIYAQLGMSPVRYWQRLIRFASTTEALQLDAVTAHAITRQTQTASNLRLAGRFAA